MIRKLEHRVPPPVVGALIAPGMWLLAAVGLRAFLSRRTTVNPLRPERASALVTGVIYRITSNPIYIGMVFLLLAWGLYLADAAALLLGPLAYVLYLNRFQILPEERAPLALFGDDCRHHMASARRRL